MNDYRKKARALQTTSSDQVQTTMGGSKDYMPVKKEVTSRTEEAMNKACMDWAYDRIVDHESAFLKKHQGYLLGINIRQSPLLQNLFPVLLGPSLNTCP